MYATNKMQQIPFIDLFKSALHVSGDKLAHPQEHFLTVYTVAKSKIFRVLLRVSFEVHKPVV